MDTSGTQNIGGYGETASVKEYSKFNWFTKNLFQNEIMRTYRTFIKPISSNPYIFHINKTKYDWVDLRRTQLWGYMKIQVETANGELEDPVDADVWSLVNNPYHSLWSSIVIKVNGTELENSSQTHAQWKAWLSVLLNNSTSSKNKVSRHNNAFIKDDVGKGNKCGTTVLDEQVLNPDWDKDDFLTNAAKPRFKPNTEYNSGFALRRRGFVRGSPIAFNIPVLHDFMTTGKSFPGETEFEIIFTRTSDAFMFIQDKNVCTKNLKIVLTDLQLSYDSETVTNQVQNTHNAKSSKTNPRALIKKNVLRTYVKYSGETDLSKDAIFYTSKNNLPEQLIIFILPSATFNGSLQTNPYCWEITDLKLAEIGLRVNGWNDPGNFLNNTTGLGKLQLYYHFLDNIGYIDSKYTAHDIPISYEEYYGGLFMIPFDRTASKHNGYFTTLPDTGTMDIHLKLENGQTLNGNHTIAIYASYTEEIEINDGAYSFRPLESIT